MRSCYLRRPLHHFVVPLPREWEAKGRRDVVPYGVEWISVADGSVGRKIWFVL